MTYAIRRALHVPHPTTRVAVLGPVPHLTTGVTVLGLVPHLTTRVTVLGLVPHLTTRVTVLGLVPHLATRVAAIGITSHYVLLSVIDSMPHGNATPLIALPSCSADLSVPLALEMAAYSEPHTVDDGAIVKRMLDLQGTVSKFKRGRSDLLGDKQRLLNRTDLAETRASVAETATSARLNAPFAPTKRQRRIRANTHSQRKVHQSSTSHPVVTTPTIKNERRNEGSHLALATALALAWRCLLDTHRNFPSYSRLSAGA
jgi:hypothetical protein